MRTRSLWTLALLLSAPAAPAIAAKYTVGPAGSGKQYPSLSALFSAANVDLKPGDIVEVDGNATYTSSGDVGIKMRSDDGGAPGNPVRIVGLAINGKRPMLTMGSGDHVIKFEQSNHVVFEGFEITGGGGGKKSCVFSEAHDLVLRDLIIRDCPAHGLIAADHNAGSLTLEYSEIFNAGANDQRHPIYVTADTERYPGAIFRMRFNYIHDGKGGNLLKSRHNRNEIHYNWFENSFYQEIELIGPDCAAWSNGTPPPIAGDSELLGNVIVHKSSWSHAIRLGGDLNGRSRGLVRMVNNTVLIDRPGNSNAIYVQLGLRGLEMHNNAIYQPGGAPTIVGENNSVDTPSCGFTDRRPWVDGVRNVSGGDNWVQTTAKGVPGSPEWGRTLRGDDPRLTDIANRNLRPADGSPLIGNGNVMPPDAPGTPFPSPQRLPLFDPPTRAKVILDQPQARSRPTQSIAIGALERSEIASAPILVHGSMPLIPNRDALRATTSSFASGPASSVLSGTAVIPTLSTAPNISTIPRLGAATVWMSAPTNSPRAVKQRTALAAEPRSTCVYLWHVRHRALQLPAFLATKLPASLFRIKAECQSRPVLP